MDTTEEGQLQMLSIIQKDDWQPIPDDFLGTCMDGMKRLSDENVSNVIYLLAKGLNAEGRELLTSTLSFKVLQMIILALNEENTGTIKSLGQELLKEFDHHKWTNKTFMIVLNQILFPLNNWKYEYMRGRHKYELTKVCHSADPVAATQTTEEEDNTDALESGVKIESVVKPVVKKEIDLQESNEDVTDRSIETIYQCQYCALGFKRLASLKKHERECKEKMDEEETNLGDGYMETSIDDDSTRPQNRRKKRTLPPITPFSCDRCANFFNTAEELEEHVDKDDCLSCAECNWMFRSKKDWENHFRKKHDKQLFPCPNCDKVFGRISNVKKHVRCYHQQIRDYVCDICYTGFFEKSDLIKHQKSCVAEDSPCDSCGGIFPTRKTLHTHLRQKHNILACPKCDNVRFATAVEYTKHQREVHPVQDPDDLSICELCGMSVPFKHMRRHKRLKHGDKVPLEECKKCGKTFTSPYYLKRHLKIVHEKQKNFFCEVCGKGFSNSAHLNEHFGVHDNIQRYKCEKCGVGFVHRASYKRHMIKHMGSQLFECSICMRKFDTPEYLKTHARRVHKSVVKIDNFKIPGSSLPEHMRSRKKGGRQPNKLADLENMGESKVEITVKSADGLMPDIRSTVKIDSSTYQPHPTNKAIKTEPLFKAEYPEVEVETKYDVQEVDLASHQLVEVEEEGGETKIYYVPQGTGYLLIGDKTISLEGI